ncbi:MAG: SUMF1/EgtB/PvdO family nonheme iron enzyme [Thiovulaceae bacterium]|nr:SUMF1/EgtB/PvdO family nonheme iron enzyme [Sulfurimonadaceae bacterium]
MKLFFLLIGCFSFVFAIDGVKNISLNTMDSDEVKSSVSKRFSKTDLKKLELNPDYKKHISNIEKLKTDIKELLSYQKEFRDEELKYQNLVSKYNSAESKYNKQMDKIYSKNNHVKRASYYLIAHELDQDYMPSVKNHLIDKYAIEKFEQNTEIKESSKGIVSYKNSVTTNKYFGQMQVETLNDITLRDKNLNIKVLKVIQSPFVKSGSSDFSKSFEKEIDKFDDSVNLEVFQIKNIDEIKSKYIPNYSLNDDEQKQVLSSLKENINIEKSNQKFNEATKKIKTTLKRITKEHDKYIRSLNDLSTKINSFTSKLEDKKIKLDKKIDEIQELARYYSISINLDELEKMVIITPKLYSEHVALGEEKEFILRKTNSYLSKISVSQVQQSETLNSAYDLKTKNLNTTKLIEYESIHIYPFVKGKELATLIFSVVELEDKISSDDYVVKNMKYSTIEFVPVNKGFKTIFASTTEVTLGIVKEFLETHKQRKYFDSFCIDDSTLPDEAKDFSNIYEDFYEYPAVCFKVEKIDEFIEWISTKINKKVKIPTPDEWSYVASNSNSSDYCWGNDTLEELNLDEVQPENIYYENNEDTFIKPIKQFEKSRLGMYDMCGNVHEFVKDGNTLMIKGNSYISFIENSNAPAQEYTPELNTMIGIRVFYTKEK